jgi:3-isopropylmalate dehydrogenase
MPTIALLPGDGVGPEVTDAAARVLAAACGLHGIPLSFGEWPVGGAALRRGLPPLPDDTLNACVAADAVLLGAVGDRAFDGEPMTRRPEAALLALRKALGVFANYRPARIWPGLEHISPLTPDRVAGLDAVVVRELTGGLYFGEPRGLSHDGRSAVNTLVYTAEEVERVAEAAFRLAHGRRGRVVSVDKANVLETSQLWRATVIRVAARHPGIALEHMYVDACALALVLTPSRFDVILTENLFGDILSDELGGIVGSVGLLPSASLGRATGVYEPVHGSAPSLAGQDAANPTGAIASAALLLEHSCRHQAAAASIDRAIARAFADGLRTADIAEPGHAPLTCSAFTGAVLERLERVDRPAADPVPQG